ncbi:MAG: NAD(P)/FAD-dependent oxidoreductase, partial [Fimbriimonadales bacterium]
MKPVVIVGAGLAGLTCARALKRNRIPFLIIDADDRMGGRLKTDVVGNFHLDRGYQVYFTAYPHAKEQLDEDKLKLRKFPAGCYVVWDGELQLLSRDQPLHLALSSFLGMGDKLRLGRWTSDVQWLDQVDIDDIPDRTSDQYLRDEGFSNDFIDRFARPFFGGVFLDRSLSTSCRQLIFVWKAINEGESAIPALGIEEIPRQIGASFGHDGLRLNTRVAEVVKQNSAAVGVKLESGEVVDAEQVVLACDASNAARLSGIPIPIDFRQSITLYFTAAQPPVPAGCIVLNGNTRGITNHVVSMPADETLISATILGERPETDEQLAEIVKSELRVWFPGQDVEAWKFLRGYRLANAQMVQPPGFKDQLPANDSGIPGLYFAGEF